MKFVQDNIWLIVIAATSGLGLLFPLIKRRFSDIPELGVSDAVLLINRRDAVIVDVREQAEFAQGHLPNARHIPLSQFKTRLGELTRFKAKPLLVHCATGGRSHGAAEMLKADGFAEVFSLRGGIGAWQQAGMPVEK